MSYKPFRLISRGVLSFLAPIYKPLVGAKYGTIGIAAGLSVGIQDLTGFLKDAGYGSTKAVFKYVYVKFI